MKKLFGTIYILVMPVFLMAQVERYSVVINEILADPSPVVGLPNTEYIELRNNSKQRVNLFKWKIDNGSTSSTISIQYILEPDSLVVLCSKTQAVFFNNPNRTIGLTSFPTLNNDGDIISLSAADGKTIHGVEYDNKWYNNSIKSAGGWSLEMIDPYKPCDKNNWGGSIHFSGGTPGKENSIFKKQTASEKIEALQCIALNANLISLQLNQGADSSSLGNVNNFELGIENIHPEWAKAIPPLFNKTELYFKNALSPKTIYSLKATSILRCLDKISDTILIKTGLSKPAEEQDLAINELLFDPPPNGADYVELVNISNSIINAKEIYLSNKNEIGTLGTPYQCSLSDYNIFPGEYLTVTTDAQFIMKNWPKSNQATLKEIKTLPSFPDDNGHVVLMNKQGKIIDEFKYSDDFHFPLLREKSGVSLEKTNPQVPSNFSINWHSAAASSGYGTPTHLNSQFINNDTSKFSILISPENFSPNNDGIADIISIQYKFPTPENLVSIYAFDFNGSMVKKIIDNQLCGTSGMYFWDGLDQNRRKVRPGFYIIFTEAIDLSGNRKVIKKMIGVM
jgi:hypothetical protein